MRQAKKKESTLSHLWSLAKSALAGFSVSGLIALGIIIHESSEHKQRAYDSLSTLERSSQLRKKSTLPKEGPSISQESVDLALKVFNIEVPENTLHPQFDPTLEDRGLTVKSGAIGKMKVTIGPDAFASWALLGSTLAHEIEVHCKQNFVAIHMLDVVGLDGTGQAEREAYLYELTHSQRFGLTPYDQDIIRNTMNYFYPQKESTLRLPPFLYQGISSQQAAR